MTGQRQALTLREEGGARGASMGETEQNRQPRKIVRGIDRKGS